MALFGHQSSSVRFFIRNFTIRSLVWFLVYVACESDRATSSVVLSSSPHMDSDEVLLCLWNSFTFAVLDTIFKKVHAFIPNFGLRSSPDVFHHFTVNDFLPPALTCTCISASVVVVVSLFFIRWAYQVLLGQVGSAFSWFNKRPEGTSPLTFSFLLGSSVCVSFSVSHSSPSSCEIIRILSMLRYLDEIPVWNRWYFSSCVCLFCRQLMDIFVGLCLVERRFLLFLVELNPLIGLRLFVACGCVASCFISVYGLVCTDIFTRGVLRVLW